MSNLLTRQLAATLPCLLLAAITSITFAQDTTGNQLRNLAGISSKERNPIPRQTVWPHRAGQATVCTWKDDKLAAVTITIDDNTKPDHSWWLEQGEKYDIPLTWFAVTGGISVRNPNFTGTWEDFQKLVDAGHDVQSHAATHRSKKANWPVDKDYRVSIDHLTANLKGTQPLTLAYPGGGLPNDPAVAATMFAGARGTRGTVNSASPDYLDVHSCSGSRSFDVPKGERGDFASLVAKLQPGHGKDPIPCWYSVHYHGVHYNAKWRDKIEPHAIRLMQYISDNRDLIWPTFFRHAVLYGQQRDTATLKTVSSTADEFTIELTDRMYDAWYDSPLTIKVRLPQNWPNIQATQAGNPINVKVVEHEKAMYALVDAIPDRGLIALTAITGQQ